MPPFREQPILIDRNLSGETLKVLRELGHGHRINVVDASYDIPRDAHVLDYPGSTAEAAVGIMRLIPIEADEAIYMEPDAQLKEEWDQSSIDFAARTALIEAQDTLKSDSISISFDGHYRKDEQELSKPGFYAIANESPDNSTFVRTIDNLPYACVSFIVGHSQLTD